jgi:hypothetical protein
VNTKTTPPLLLVSASLALLVSASLPLSGCAAEVGTPGESGGEENVASSSEAIRDPTPAPADFLLSAVKVFTWRGGCSGTLIARDRVLTAAHCVCTEDLVGSNFCATDADVGFRDDPAGGDEPENIHGTVTHHPNYNPSFWDAEIENDIAVIALDSDAPSFVPTMPVANSKPAVGSNVMMAGFGFTGPNCDGDPGSLNFDIVRVDRIVDSGRILQFDNPAGCGADSGCPLLNPAGTAVFAVYSGTPPTIQHGRVDKSILTQPYYAWIRSHTCSSALNDRCDRKADMCRCAAGIGDCDVDADCRPGLRCAQNVGATFGFESHIDVCVPATGPIQGTCTCRNSGLGNMCVADFNGCSAGFSAICSPQTGTGGTSGCGGCSCQ